MVNVARADAATADPDTTNNNGSSAANRVTTTIGPLADLAVTKTGPASVNALGAITYTLDALNNGPSPASAVAVTDTLPAGVTFVSATGGGVFAGGVVTWPPVPSLANGASVSYNLTVTAPATGTLVNVAAGTSATPDPIAGNNDGSAAASRVTTAIGEVADVAVTYTGPAAVDPLAPIGYSLTVTNNGPSAAAVTVADTLPAGVTFVSASNGGTLAGNVVTWPAIASLGTGASVTYTVNVTAPVSGTLVSLATAASSTADPDPSNNNGSATASRVTTVVDAVDLVVEKTHIGRFEVGQTGLYTIVVRNVGTTTATGSVAVTDSLPNGLTYISANGLGWSFAGQPASSPPHPVPRAGRRDLVHAQGGRRPPLPSVTTERCHVQEPSGRRVTDAYRDARAGDAGGEQACEREVEIAALDYSISISIRAGRSPTWW